MMDRISICEALAKRNEIDPFLKRMVTGDKKGVTYYNIMRKRSWSKRGEAVQTVAKPELVVRKVLLCIWLDWKGIIYYELLLYDQTLNSDLYRLKLAIDQKRPESSNLKGVVFHQDNARQHSSVVTRQKLWELGWEVLMHPPYCPDLAPSDYDLFLTLQNFLSDKKLGSREDCENRLLEFLATLVPRHLDRAEAVAHFRLTTRHDFWGIYHLWLGVAANEVCPLCSHTRMDGDHLLQCTG
ncbi:mariner Mos1 transposase [Trichonephila clavipes]|nr:mariner Mos1 transposase [Trichonephila clavipes]